MGRVKRAEQLTDSAHVLARLARVLETACQEAGISLPQYRVLVFLHSGPERAGEVAARAAVSRPTLTAIVDGLERQGLLDRARVDDDGRGIRLELTTKGRAVLADAERSVRNRIERILAAAGATGIVDDLRAIGEELDRERAARQAGRSSTANAAHIRE